MLVLWVGDGLKQRVSVILIGPCLHVAHVPRLLCIHCGISIDPSFHPLDSFMHSDSELCSILFPIMLCFLASSAIHSFQWPLETNTVFNEIKEFHVGLIFYV